MTLTFAMSYGVSEPRRPTWARGPAWWALNSQATILPSALKPLRTWISAAGRKVDQTISSVRV